MWTPDELAVDIVRRLPIMGSVLEPCLGGGAFMRALEAQGHTVQWCEISQGVDFTKFQGQVDWIVTNPPWSKFAMFLEKSLQVADNIVFLVTWNHFTTKKRLRLIQQAGFWFREIRLIPTPSKECGWPQSGFQVCVVWLHRGFKGGTTIH